MADIDNNGLNQYGVPVSNSINKTLKLRCKRLVLESILSVSIENKDITFLDTVYKYVSDKATRHNIIKNYFEENDNDNNIGDC